MENQIYSTPKSELDDEYQDNSELASRRSHLWASIRDLLIIVILGLGFYFIYPEEYLNGVKFPYIFTFTVAIVLAIIFCHKLEHTRK